jgi:hypothetical protein
MWLGVLLWPLVAPADSALLLADFDKDPTTYSGGEIAARQRTPSSVKWGLDPDHNARDGAGQSLRIDYSRLRGGEECMVILRIPGTDATPYDRLTFWVKGAEGGEIFDLAMRDEQGDRAEKFPAAVLPIEKALPGGVTTEWQKVSVPLREVLQGTGRPASILIVFNRITKFSTIYVDDFQLEAAQEPAPAKH